jgi:hypothetical protein
MAKGRERRYPSAQVLCTHPAYAPFEDLARPALRLAVDDIEDAYGAVRRARGKSLAVVVQLGVVLTAV